MKAVALGILRCALGLLLFTIPGQAEGTGLPSGPLGIAPGDFLVQSYLDSVDDMRDLMVKIETTRALHTAEEGAKKSYATLLERQKRLLAAYAISREEYEHSVFDYEYAAAKSEASRSLIGALEARFEQREYQRKIAAKQIVFKLDDYYALFSREWSAECEASKSGVLAARALVNLSRFLYEMASTLEQKQAGSYYELELRTRELVAAEADLHAKLAIDSKCLMGLPTLEELRALQKKPWPSVATRR